MNEQANDPTRGPAVPSRGPRRSGDLAATALTMDAADVVWFDRALAEVIGDDAPPDLRGRVRAATAAQRAAAAATIDAAAPVRSHRWLAAAVVLFGLSIVASVFALQRGAALATLSQVGAQAQEPATEVAVADAAQLTALLPQLTGLTLIARSNAAGARLPELPEHAAWLGDAALRAQLIAALTNGNAIGPAFGRGDAQAELLLHLDGRRTVTARLKFTADAVAFGTASFARSEPLPAALATGLRTAWQQLATATPKPRQKIQVGSTRELIAAIGSDRTIELAGGPFVLAPSDDKGELPANPAVTFRDNWGSPFLEIHGVHNLHLRAIGEHVRLLGKSPSDVIAFVECENVWVDGLIVGHVEGLEHSCSAPVVTLRDCRGVTLRDCELFGCGTVGLVAGKSRGIALERCEVHTCRYAIVQLAECSDVRFAATRFRDCGMVSNGFEFVECERVAFADCSITGMDSRADGLPGDAILFDVRMDEAVRFERGAIRGNRCKRLATSKLLLARDGTDERDNGPDAQIAPTDRPGLHGIGPVPGGGGR